MKVSIDGKTINIRAVWMHDWKRAIIRMIDQRFLPWRFQIFESKSTSDTYRAIKDFVVRGAPTIGATAAYGVCQAVREAINKKDFINEFTDKISLLKSARPTAHNLFHAIEFVSKYAIELYKNNESHSRILEETYNRAENYVQEEIDKNKKIGMYGERLIKDGYKILTHCNAGALAGIDLGTATAPIYVAHEKGKKITVYATETRPWLQGARITAWELIQQGIESYVITDNAAGYLMWKGEIDLVIVGADRIAMNGDVANKIGTYKLALAAKDNNIPFYVAAPTSTIDPTIKDGREIPIEERSEDEVHYVRGEEEDAIRRVRITPKGARAKNPVFDITPARLITGIITEKGIFRPHEIGKALGST